MAVRAYGVLAFGVYAWVAPASGWAEIVPGQEVPGQEVSGQAASAGPGRIVCNATFCELAIAERTRPRVRVIVSALPANEIRRLRKCTGVAKPCLVSVDGTAREHPFSIMATDIHWQD